jgi:hypothetical protein
VDLLFGYRFLELTDSLSINEFSQTTGTNQQGLPVGTVALTSDRFGTRNEFNGGQVGTDVCFHLERWSFDFLGKIALGNTTEVININGTQVVLRPNAAPVLSQGGLLAVPLNSGRFTRDRISVVPELGVKLGYDVTENLRLTLGYTWLFWSDVVRPADQIDRVIDARQISNFPPPPGVVFGPVAGQSHPLVPFRGTDFWAQGLTVGLEYKY